MDRHGLRQTVSDAPQLSFARDVLRDFGSRTELISQELLDRLKVVKSDAVRVGEEFLAAAVWCLEQSAEAQSEYVTAFRLAQEDRYYESGQALQRSEIPLGILGRHCEDPLDDYRVA